MSESKMDQILGSLANWLEEQEELIRWRSARSGLGLSSFWRLGRKAVLRSSFLVCCSRLASSRSILIISFWRNSMKRVCSWFFFFSSGSSGRCLSSSCCCWRWSSSHCFSERMWFMFLASNLNWLNSSMQRLTMGSWSLMRLSSLLVMAALSTSFSPNLTMRVAYLLERRSLSVMECRLMVSSNTTYRIQPLALQVRLPSSSQCRKKNSNFTPSFFMNYMQSAQFALSLLPTRTTDEYARIASPYFTRMNASRMKISGSSFSVMSVRAEMVMRVSVRELLTMSWRMLRAAALACISRCSFSSRTASKNTCELTFSAYLAPRRKVSTVRISFPTGSLPRRSAVQMQSPWMLVRSERSTSADSTSSRSELSRKRCGRNSSMSSRWESPAQTYEKASSKSSWLSLVKHPVPREIDSSSPIFTLYRRAFRSASSSLSSDTPAPNRLPIAFISWMISYSDIPIKLIATPAHNAPQRQDAARAHRDHRQEASQRRTGENEDLMSFVGLQGDSCKFASEFWGVRAIDCVFVDQVT